MTHKVFTMEDMMARIEERRQRERWYKPGIWMFWSVKRHIRDWRYEVKYAWQRVFRGWDDRAGFSTGHYLAKNLGEQLVSMSENAHGWPGVGWTYDEWVSALKANGEALRAFWRLDDEEVERGDYEDWQVHHEATVKAAQDALRWVADNLETLWD
jgi:hypothetical protein